MESVWTIWQNQLDLVSEILGSHMDSLFGLQIIILL